MSLQPMPVLDRLLAKRHSMHPDIRIEVDEAWGAVKVRADAASDMYWQTPKEVWGKGDFPPVRMPFPAIWMEWEQPRFYVTDGGRVVERTDPIATTEMGEHRAVLLKQILDPGSLMVRIGDETLPVIEPSGTAHAFSITCHMLREGFAVYFPYTGIVHVDEHGSVLQEIVWAGSAIDPRTRAIDPRARVTVDIINVEFGKLALLALGLMNCRNVSLTECVAPVPIGRRQRRRNNGVAYRTIDIPGHEPAAPTAVGGDPQPFSMHRVRGHFKTFTADSPLMGQHVGTYWWGWQVRGKKENGVVVSDYKIGSPE